MKAGRLSNNCTEYICSKNSELQKLSNYLVDHVLAVLKRGEMNCSYSWRVIL